MEHMIYNHDSVRVDHTHTGRGNEKRIKERWRRGEVNRGKTQEKNSRENRGSSACFLSNKSNALWLLLWRPLLLIPFHAAPSHPSSPLLFSLQGEYVCVCVCVSVTYFSESLSLSSHNPLLSAQQESFHPSILPSVIHPSIHIYSLADVHILCCYVIRKGKKRSTLNMTFHPDFHYG